MTKTKKICLSLIHNTTFSLKYKLFKIPKSILSTKIHIRQIIVQYHKNLSCPILCCSVLCCYIKYLLFFNKSNASLYSSNGRIQLVIRQSYLLTPHISLFLHLQWIQYKKLGFSLFWSSFENNLKVGIYSPLGLMISWLGP